MKKNNISFKNKRGMSFLCFFLGFTLIFSACNKDDNDLPEIINDFTVTLTPSQIIPSISDRTETGTVTLKLMSDNSIDYSISVEGLNTTDELTTAYICSGSPVESGEILVTLTDNADRKFVDNKVESTLSLTSDQANTIKTQKTYLIVLTNEKPQGLLRGQVGMSILLACDVVLSPENEIPPVVGRNESGFASIRLTDNNELYYNISVENLSPVDKLENAKILKGSNAETGACLCILCESTLDFYKSKKINISSQEATCLQNDLLYISVYTIGVPTGLLRGQIR